MVSDEEMGRTTNDPSVGRRLEKSMKKAPERPGGLNTQLCREKPAPKPGDAVGQLAASPNQLSPTKRTSFVGFVAMR